MLPWLRKTNGESDSGRSGLSCRGFTLIELLVAMVVLVLLLTIVLQMTQGVFGTWRSSDARFKNFIIARSVLESIAADFEDIATVSGPDKLLDSSTDETLQFVSRRGGIDAGVAARPLTFVRYYAQDGELWREEKRYLWNERPDFNQPVETTRRDSLCEGVVALWVRLVELGGMASGTANEKRLSAVGVSLAIIDPDALQRLRDQGQAEEIERSLSAIAAGTPTGMVPPWQDWLESSSEVSPTVREHLHFFHRTFPLRNREGQP